MDSLMVLLEQETLSETAGNLSCAQLSSTGGQQTESQVETTPISHDVSVMFRVLKSGAKNIAEYNKISHETEGLTKKGGVKPRARGSHRGTGSRSNSRHRSSSRPSHGESGAFGIVDEKKREEIVDSITKKIAPHFIHKAGMMDQSELYHAVYQEVIKYQDKLGEQGSQQVMSRVIEEVTRAQKENHPLIRVSKELSKHSEFNRLMTSLQDGNYFGFKQRSVQQSQSYQGFSDLIAKNAHSIIQLGNNQVASVNSVVFALSADKLDPLEEYMIIDDSVSLYRDLITHPELFRNGDIRLQSSSGRIFNSKSNSRLGINANTEVNNVKLHIYLRYMIYNLRSGRYTIDQSVANEFNQAVASKSGNSIDVIQAIFRAVGYTPLIVMRDGKAPLTASHLKIRYSDFDMIRFDHDYIIYDNGGSFSITPDDGSNIASMMKQPDYSQGYQPQPYNPCFQGAMSPYGVPQSGSMFSSSPANRVLDCNGVLVIEIDRRPSQTGLGSSLSNTTTVNGLNITLAPITLASEHLLTKTIGGKTFGLSSALCWKTNDLGSISPGASYIEGVFCLKRVTFGEQKGWFIYDTKSIAEVRQDIKRLESSKAYLSSSDSTDLNLDPQGMPSMVTNEDLYKLLVNIQNLYAKTQEIQNIVSYKDCMLSFNEGIDYIQKQGSVLIYSQE